MAEAASPAYAITSVHSPTNFVPGDDSGTATYTVSVTNVGSGVNVNNHGTTDPSDDTAVPITVTDVLPPGLTVDTSPSGFAFFFMLDAELNGTSCDPGPPATCVAESFLHPGERLTMIIPVDISAGAPATVTNEATVSGGLAPAASTTEQATVSTAQAPFGFQSLGTWIADAAGNPVTQAGDRPYQFHTDFQLNTAVDPLSTAANPPAGSLKDIATKLPAGLVVDPSATPVRCTEAQLEAPGPNADSETGCPDASAVGVLHPTVGVYGFPNPLFSNAIYNMVPPPGVPAALGANAGGLGIYLHFLGGVDTAGDYALTADVKDLLEYGITSGASLELWGDPSDPSHDFERGKCTQPTFAGKACPVSATDTPFLTMPSACSGPLAIQFSADSWQDPGNFVTASAPTADLRGHPVGVTGCSRLPFDPTISVQPGTAAADSPAGLDVDLKVPQPSGVGTLAEANLRRAVVNLPAGMAVNPSSADGLQSCSPAQIGLHTAAAPTCPDASKVGSVDVTTPLLDHPLQGSVYLAKQTDNPFGTLLALYIAAEADGALIKLAGKVEPDPVTGQLKATFDSNPQLPFSDFRLHFNGGQRATLTTPSTCGTFTAMSDMTPWTTPEGADAFPSDSFQINAGANGGPCVSNEAQEPYGPSFEAGTTIPLAGSYSPFVLKLTRQNGSQRLSAINVTLPPGVTGKLAGVAHCSDAQLAAAAARSNPGQGAPEQASPSCPAASEVGTVTAGVGSGAPFYAPGHVYLAGPYKGAPFSLAIITPAVAGPFDLGVVVVRAALFIDPQTTQVTVKSDSLPSILQGIPLDIRSIQVNMSRPEFTLNPTSCEPMTLTGEAISTLGHVAPLSDRFQAGGCRGLPFKPTFTSTTAGNGNFHGASLDVRITQKPGEAAIRKVDTQLPLALPSRLVTLQKACTEGQFAANPAGCPPGSRVGIATAITPLLDSRLTGPAYLVSHGGAAFPDLNIVLQGEGITIDLVGHTDIKKGITYSRFETVPDAPISSFELKLPGGPGAVLAATKNLCASTKTLTTSKKVTKRVHGHRKRVTVKVKKAVPEPPLLMPTRITGQNGAVTQQNTKIAVTGCKKANAKKQGKKKAKRHRVKRR